MIVLIRATIVIVAEIVILAISLLMGGFLLASEAMDVFIEGLLDDENGER